MNSKIKRTLGLFNVVITVLTLCVSTACASRAEVISSYDVDARLNKTSRSIEVTETITVDFGKALRHGIERVFGQAQQVTVEKVSDRSGFKYKTSTTSNLGKTYLRIGSPDKQVTGTNTYRIQYRLGGAVKDDGTLDWSPTGHNWSQKISRFDLKLYSDGPLPKALTAKAKTVRSINISKDSAFHVVETAIQPGDGVDVICPLGEAYAGRSGKVSTTSTAAAAAAAAAAASALASSDPSKHVLDSMPVFLAVLMFIPFVLATVFGAIANASCSCSSEWNCKCPDGCSCVRRHRIGRSGVGSPCYDDSSLFSSGSDWSSSSTSSSECGSSDSGSSSGSDGGGDSW